MVVLLVERVRKTEADDGMRNIWMQFLTAVRTWADLDDCVVGGGNEQG